MKRLTILFTTLISVLAVLAVLQAWSASRVEAKKASSPVQVYDSTEVMLEAINPKGAAVKIAPVYDATGAMLEAINSEEAEVSQNPLIVYDATGAMLQAINP